MPEKNISAEMLRAIAGHADPRELRRLAVGIHDWEALLKDAQEHRVSPLLFSRIAGIGDAVPVPAQERLCSDYERNVLHCMSNAVELIAVLNAFDEEKIPVMPFKGVVLAASIYSDLGARAAGDLDLLIHPRDLVRATNIIRERGYELKTAAREDGTPFFPDCYEYHFEREADGMVLELRWRLVLTQPRFRRDLGLDWVWPQRRTVMLAGAEVPDMSPELTLLTLCMHGSKHVWARLNWICDVAQVLNSSPQLDWKKVVKEARKTGLWRALALGVLLANRVAGAAVPQAVLRRFEADTKARRLARHIDENLFDAPGTVPVGRTPYYVLLLGFRDRVGTFLSIDFLRPNERDQAAMALPKSLRGLYYLIRPFRLLRDRSAR